jgi:sugar transferase (PEP-CTERM/EpsH1 system associated)
MTSSARPKLLYLVHRVPHPPDKGDRIRNFHVLRHLHGRADVDVACLADEPVPESAVAALREHSRRLAVVPQDGRRWLRALASFARGRTVTEGAFASPALRRVLRAWAADTPYDACLASASGMVPYLRLAELHDVPAVVDLVDVDSQKWLDFAAAGRGPRAWLHAAEGGRLRKLERDLPTWCRAVTLVSEAEAGVYRSFCAAGRVCAVTNGCDLNYFQPVADVGGRDCVFVGALDYAPNVDGVLWFVHEVWPAVRQRHPDLKLQLVGRRPTPAVTRLGDVPGVEVVGQVPDVRPHVARAGLVVVPLRLARGVQNKVLEALAMAKATVVSPQAREGLKARPEQEVLVASTSAEWVAAIDRLLGDEGLRQRLGSAGRAYVEARHRWDVCLEPLAELLALPAADEGASRAAPCDAPTRAAGRAAAAMGPQPPATRGRPEPLPCN